MYSNFNCDLFKSRDNDTKHLKRLYGMYHFKQLIAKATRVTSDTRTLIDHIATNQPDNGCGHTCIFPRCMIPAKVF